ncbi:hypothetical protein GE061_012010 [Apolygus lucorum]|uniref:WH1 domain-containing protein n=1 Tax=Apolygus lucorum TaxID=248454 RepID=A0A8S9XTD4_APOLU|nr:hypothetical protein GE061_012010 [Apolygus lucorum]
MGNKLSCSCAPLMRKAYRYEDSPWQASRRRDGHLLRLWAEVFHVSSSGAGTVKWQQVSEDLVPVNITCIQDSPECVFHITAYNSQVDKVLDVRLVQPGTRIGQASECFVYWKDPMTNDTWGLNFTSPIDAKQFRECCSPSFKFSRKASSSYSLKLEPPNKQNKVKTKRKPLSTPASPSRSREPQCTCMTADQYARLRAQDPRYRGGSSTLPRTGGRTVSESGVDGRASALGDKVAAATSSTSLYDNVTSAQQQMAAGGAATATSGATGGGNAAAAAAAARQRQTRDQVTSTTATATTTGGKGEERSGGCGSGGDRETQKSEGTQAGVSAGKTSTGTCTPRLIKDSQTQSGTAEMQPNNNNINNINNNINNNQRNNNRKELGREMSLDSNTLKRMLKPMPSLESPVTSPEMTRRRYNYYNQYLQQNNNMRGAASQPRDAPRRSGSRSMHEMGRGARGASVGDYGGGSLYLELDGGGGGGPGAVEGSPPSDNVLFDNQCYATTPSSSNGNSDLDQPVHVREERPQPKCPYQRRYGGREGLHTTVSTPSSPTSRLLLEYEMHLRNTLAKGMDAESYSLHTFEALLTQSMENLEFAEQLPTVNSRSPYPNRRNTTDFFSGSEGRSGMNKSSTLPLPHRLSLERPASSAAITRDGYYSDRGDVARERGYLSDHNSSSRNDLSRDRGYLSDHNSSSRCASCLGESARAQWFRHSDGWRSGSSTLGSCGSYIPPGSAASTMSGAGSRRSPWESLPSLRHEGSLNDSGYKSNRADSFEQSDCDGPYCDGQKHEVNCSSRMPFQQKLYQLAERGAFDRQDSLRSDYMSDREGSRYGIVQQASIESTDSRLCYLTSSERQEGI